MKLFNTVLGVILVGSFTLNAQVTVTNVSQTVEDMVINELLGTGVTVSNIMFNGGSANVINRQVGVFADANSDVGIGGGLIMGTGNVAMAAQFNTGNDSSLGGSGTQGVDTNLAAITPNQIFDECVIEFDFVPVGDTIKFNYVFASEEYEEFVCGTVNDAFGFFLWGPNPGGGDYVARNLALIPDPSNLGQFTNTPVSINTVNPGVAGASGDVTNCNAIDPNWVNYNIFYTENSTDTYEYNGKTVVLQARIAVNCGDTYHIKLAIGDAGDELYDSGVFLEKNSLGASGFGVFSFANYAGVQGQLIGEMCGQAGFVFNTPDTTQADTIHFEIFGNAEVNSDYSFFPDSIILPQGVASDTLFIDFYQDFQNEDLDSLGIEILNVQGCNTAMLYIESIPPMYGTLGIDSVNICPPELTTLTASFTGGKPPYSIYWDVFGGEGDTIVVSPDETTFYTAIATDVCGNTYEVGTSDVWVQCPVAPTNVFTPNGDGVNDLFKAFYLGDYDNSSMVIYNRWGKVVYESENYQNDWDGTHYKTGAELKEGVYYYIITVNSYKYEYTEHKDIDITKTISGYVHLFR